MCWRLISVKRHYTKNIHKFSTSNKIVFFQGMGRRGFYFWGGIYFFLLIFWADVLRGYSSWLWNCILSIEIVLNTATSWHCGYSLFYLTDTTPHPTMIPSRRRQTRLSAQTRCYRCVYCFLACLCFDFYSNKETFLARYREWGLCLIVNLGSNEYDKSPDWE